jgi:hypothetical protein
VVGDIPKLLDNPLLPNVKLFPARVGVRHMVSNMSQTVPKAPQAFPKSARRVFKKRRLTGGKLSLECVADSQFVWMDYVGHYRFSTVIEGCIVRVARPNSPV